jgi:dCMP deaminase
MPSDLREEDEPGSVASVQGELEEVKAQAPPRVSTAMLIVLLGLPLSGKSAVAKRLVVHDGFTRVRLAVNASPTQDKADLVLPDAAAFLDYATERWRTRFVTTDLGTDPKIIDAFRKRPWVLLVSVEAPITVRYRRATQRCACCTHAARAVNAFGTQGTRPSTIPAYPRGLRRPG